MLCVIAGCGTQRATGVILEPEGSTTQQSSTTGQSTPNIDTPVFDDIRNASDHWDLDDRRNNDDRNIDHRGGAPLVNDWNIDDRNIDHRGGASLVHDCNIDDWNIDDRNIDHRGGASLVHDWNIDHWSGASLVHDWNIDHRSGASLFNDGDIDDHRGRPSNDNGGLTFFNKADHQWRRWLWSRGQGGLFNRDEHACSRCEPMRRAAGGCASWSQ